MNPDLLAAVVAAFERGLPIHHGEAFGWTFAPTPPRGGWVAIYTGESAQSA